MTLIVCPFGRPERLEHVLGLWRRQSCHVDLLLVGREPGPWEAAARAEGALALTGRETIGEARTAGLHFARDLGSDWVIQWDDDNYYGPRYVERILGTALPGVDVVCLGLGFVRMARELWRFPSGVPFFPGHSTAVRTAVAPDFLPVSRGEDVAWSRAFSPDRKRVRQLEPWGLIYDRTGDGHAYDADRAEFFRTFGGGVHLGELPDSFVDEPSELPDGPLVTASDDEVFASLERRLRRDHASNQDASHH